MFWYILGAIVTIPVIWLLFSLLISLTAPPEVLGYNYLKKKLSQSGIDPSKISHSVLIYGVEDSLKGARTMKNLRGLSKVEFNSELTKLLDSFVYQLETWLAGDFDDPMFATDNELRELFEKELGKK